ncbi:MAG: ATP synthase F0 subunit C [bacterium]|nr:ATP synthase F0 subunit C [bacterium]
MAITVFAALPAFAQEGQEFAQAAAAAPGNFLDAKAMALFAAALAIGLTGFAAALGQGNALAKAMESIGRNPESAGSVRGTLMIGLAFIESMAIYGLLIAFVLSGKG